jgi:hypothetical protein
MSAEEAAADLDSVTPEWIVAFVDKWDSAHTDGKGPNYVQKLGATTTGSGE